jgi:hypothetical protein
MRLPVTAAKPDSRSGEGVNRYLYPAKARSVHKVARVIREF